MTEQPSVSCKQLVERTTDYLENALDARERSRFEAHLHSCAACGVYFEQMQTMVGALGRLGAEPAPAESKRELMEMFRRHTAEAAPPARAMKQERPGTARLGIGEARVAPGAHMAYFWESDAEFEQALGFLEEGIRAGDHCFIFGHDAANQKIVALLRQRGADTDALAARGRISVVGGNASGAALLANLGSLFQQALDGGAPMIRLLGNLGWGRAQWPVEDEILEFEARVTTAAGQFPCIIVCMYDVRSVSGRVLLRGGLETHPATICREVVRENPHFVPTEQFLAGLGQRSGTGRTQ